MEIIKELASDLFSMQETYIDQLKDNRGIDTSAINKISVIDQRIQDKLKTILESKISSKENSNGDSAKRDLDLFISFFNIALLILAFYFLRINLISPFFELIKNLEHISNKNYINLDSHTGTQSEIDSVYYNLNQLQKAFRNADTELTKFKVAIDNVSTNIMMSDIDLNVTYMNSSIKEMFKSGEMEIRKQLPNFSVAGLMKSNIDSYHKTPSHQRNLLANLKDTHTKEKDF